MGTETWWISKVYFPFEKAIENISNLVYCQEMEIFQHKMKQEAVHHGPL